MKSFLNALRILVALLPAIVDLVKTIERTLPIPGIGGDKLELLKEIVTAAWEALAEDARGQLSLDSLLKAAVAIANRLVAIYNRAGWTQEPASRR